jgi:acetyl esterase/lipase
MKKVSMISFWVSIFQLAFSGINAQTLPDSTLQKIKNFRAFYESLGQAYPKDSTIAEAETEIAGVTSYWFNQKQLTQKSIVVYLHGGVYTYGSINAYRAMLSHLAASLQVPVLYIEYALSPEHPFPTANNEILRVYTALRKKYPGHKITIIGDSAGGGLAITLVQGTQQANLAAPDAIALISPWIDLKCINGSYLTKQSVDPILNKEFLYSHALMYAGKNIKPANPGELKFTKFPPVFLLVGSNEVLYDDSRNFYAYIKPIQPKAQLKEFPGQTHVWVFSNVHAPASRQAINDIRDFISSAIK